MYNCIQGSDNEFSSNFVANFQAPWLKIRFEIPENNHRTMYIIVMYNNFTCGFCTIYSEVYTKTDKIYMLEQAITM